MTNFKNLGFYEVEYNNKIFRYLEYIRLDNICDEIYITVKNVLTGEILTFEHSGINWIREMNLLAELVPIQLEGIAQTEWHSLY